MKKVAVIFCLFALIKVAYADTFYLDPDGDGTTGADWAHAFTTISSAVSAMSGSDTLIISGEATTTTYTVTSTVSIPAGSDGNPTILQISSESGHNGVAVFDGGDLSATSKVFSCGRYVRIDGRVSGDTYTGWNGMDFYNQHIKIQNWGEQVLTLDAAISGDSNGGMELYGIFLYNDDTTCADNECSDFEFRRGIYANGDDNIISNCKLDGCVRESILIGFGTTWDANIVEKNIIKSYYRAADSQAMDDETETFGYGSADAIKRCGGTTIRYNWIYSEPLTDADYNPGHKAEDGIQIVANTSDLSDYIKIYGNLINGEASDIRMDSTSSTYTSSHIWIYSNILYNTADGYSAARGFEYDCGPCSSAAINYIEDVKFYNNTILDYPYRNISINTGSVTSGNIDIEVKNNISITDYDSGGTTITLQGTYATATDVDYNLFLRSNLSTESPGTISPSGSVSQTNNPFDSGEVMAFTSYTAYSSSNDLSLPATATMAIEAGTDLGSTYEVDILGNTRSGTWDLGAYDYTGDGNITCYNDDDNDTYQDESGLSESVPTTCSSNYYEASHFYGSSPNSDDCDDTNAAINPGATDSTCNGIDENCDGNDDSCIAGNGAAYNANGKPCEYNVNGISVEVP